MTNLSQSLKPGFKFMWNARVWTIVSLYNGRVKMNATSFGDFTMTYLRLQSYFDKKQAWEIL